MGAPGNSIYSVWGWMCPLSQQSLGEGLAGWESENLGSFLLFGQTLRPGFRVPFRASWKPWSVGLMPPILLFWGLFPVPVLLPHSLSVFIFWEHYLKNCLCTNQSGAQSQMAPLLRARVALWARPYYNTDQSEL